jgi:multidrug efflux system outer membrane protein
MRRGFIMHSHDVKKGLRFASVAAIAIALSGCFVSRVDPQKPELPLPAALPAPTETTTSLPDPWWKIFGDERLDELIHEALAHNADVAIAAARVAQARGTLGIANSDRWPSLDLEGDATRSKESNAVFVPGGDVQPLRTTYRVQGAISYELDLWGRYARAAESARADLLSSEFGREATKLSLTGDVARGYFGLIAAYRQLQRARDTLATRDESLKLEKLRFDSGESDEFTYKRAEADAAATRKSVHQLELELTQRANDLSILLGRSPKDLVENAIAVNDAQLPAPVVLPAELPSTVLERRPDIGAAEAALNASAADIGVVRAAVFPSISLTGLFGSLSTELGDLFTKPMEAWSVTGGLVQPLFQAGRLRAGISRAEAVREQRKAEYVRTVQVAFSDVHNALRGQTLIANVREANAQQVAALTRATQLADLRYSQGDIAYLELLDVRRGLFQAEIDLVAAQRDALLNTVDLALAVGGGMGELGQRVSAR